MIGKNIHTKPQGTRWINVIEGSGEIVSIHMSKREATFVGQLIALRDSARHLVHDQAGIVRERSAFGYLSLAQPLLG